MSTKQQIRIVINGEARSVAHGQSISELLRALEIAPERVAVELNRRIVKPGEWADTLVAEGAEVEIVQFVGGG